MLIINNKTVEELMLADGEGGFWFKRMFMVLKIIETSTCGTIKSKIGHIIEDLDNVRNVNWCLYTMSVLKLGMENWLKQRRMLLQTSSLPLGMFYIFHYILLRVNMIILGCVCS